VGLIDWPCKIAKLFRDRNLGCKNNVSQAISWFFENESEGIVLEDDCRPTLDFLRFASVMLEKYRDDNRIGAICGFNCFNLQTDKNCSYHFSRHMDVWGWASWRRVWKDYTVEIPDVEEISKLIDGAKLTSYCKNFFRKLSNDVVTNGLSTWDVQFSLLFLKKDYFSVVPKERLTVNVGVSDSRATHTGGYIYWGREWSKASSMNFPICHPTNVVCDEKADYIRERMEGAVFPRGLTWLGVKFPFLCRWLSMFGRFIQKIMPFLFRW
jgi:hypothetical protein